MKEKSLIKKTRQFTTRNISHKEINYTLKILKFKSNDLVLFYKKSLNKSKLI